MYILYCTVCIMIFTYAYVCRRSTGKEGEFFVQLFLEPDADVSPDTESLLRKMFVDQGIIFDEVSLQ